jgi:hypothetical protein
MIDRSNGLPPEKKRLVRCFGRSPEPPVYQGEPAAIP